MLPMVFGVDAERSARFDECVGRRGCGFERSFTALYVRCQHGRGDAGMHEVRDGSATDPKQKRNGSEKTHQDSSHYDASA